MSDVKTTWSDGQSILKNLSALLLKTPICLNSVLDLADCVSHIHCQREIILLRCLAAEVKLGWHLLLLDLKGTV